MYYESHTSSLLPAKHWSVGLTSHNGLACHGHRCGGRLDESIERLRREEDERDANKIALSAGEGMTELSCLGVRIEDCRDED